VTRKEVEEIKEHFDAATAGLRTELVDHIGEQVGGLRTELRAEIAGMRRDLGADIAGVRQDLGTDIAAVRQDLGGGIDEIRRHVGVVAEDLRSEIRMVADGVALANERINQVDLRVDGLTGEMRRGFAGLRAEMRGLHETDDELRRRIEAQERRGA
jgi:hypothetical protein